MDAENVSLCRQTNGQCVLRAHFKSMKMGGFAEKDRRTNGGHTGRRGRGGLTTMGGEQVCNVFTSPHYSRLLYFRGWDKKKPTALCHLGVGLGGGICVFGVSG